jgi:hypothetical protein
LISLSLFFALIAVLLYSKKVFSLLQYFRLSNLAFLILITLSHSLFHHTHSGCFSSFPIFPCPPFPRLFFFFFCVDSSNFPLIIWIKFSYLSFTFLSLFHPLCVLTSNFFHKGYPIGLFFIMQSRILFAAFPWFHYAVTLDRNWIIVAIPSVCSNLPGI